MPPAPALAIVIVTYESARHLPRTFRSLLPQLTDGDELHVVDCGSSDDPGAVLAREAPRAVLHALAANLGFAGGANVGAASSSAPLLLFLNPDVELAEGSLAALRATAATQPSWGAWQALVTLPGGETINTSGGMTHWLGLGWAGECDQPVPPISTPAREVSFASGAALVVRRAVWEQLDGFDPRYFMYGEDVDLSLRVRLAGWGVGVVPDARVEHDYDFVKGDYKWFHLERNRWWTILGAYPTSLLLALAPALLAFELALLPIAARGGWLGAKLRSQVAVLRTLPWALRRRTRVQKQRRTSTRAFAKGLSGSLDSPYLGAVAQIAPLRALQSGYWAFARAALELLDE